MERHSKFISAFGIRGWVLSSLLCGALGIWACSTYPQANAGSCVANADCPAGDTCVLGQCQSPNENNNDNDAGIEQGTDAGNQQVTGMYCSSCSSSSDCGDGNFCVQGVCGVACESVADCPEGAGCYTLSNGSKNCFPMSGSCDSVPVPDAGPQEHDAGPTEHDAGPQEQDAGPQEHDAGPQNHDAGTMTHDAGMTTPDAGVCSPDTWANHWSSWFSSNCFSCHQHSGETESWVKSNASTIERYINSGQMPPGSSGDPTDSALIKTWAGCGYP
jgi:hypothetical protein